MAYYHRDIYEKAIQTVITVWDFTHLFDDYAQFEELSLKIIVDKGEKKQSEDENMSLDLYMARSEDVIEW